MLVAFVRAVLAGTLAGAAPALLFTTAIAAFMTPDNLADGRLDRTLLLLVLPFAVAGPCVLLGSLVLGVPTAVLLRRTGQESKRAYLAAGAIGGALLPVTLLGLVGAPAGYWAGLYGAFAGIVTASTWWRATRSPAAPVTAPSALAPPRHPPDTRRDAFP